MKKSIALLVALVLLLSAGLASAASFTDKESQVAFTLPDGWKKDSSVKGNDSLKLQLFPDTGKKTQDSASAIQFLRIDLYTAAGGASSGTTRAGMNDSLLSRELVQVLVGNNLIMELTEKKINGIRFMVCRYYAVTKGIPVSCCAAVTVHNGYLVMLQFLSVTAYDKYLPVFEKTLSTVKIGASSQSSRSSASSKKGSSAVTVKNLNYELDTKKKTAAFTGPKSKNVTAVTIPATVRVKGTTYRVTEIRAGACKNLKKLVRLTIGKNVVKIGKDAFSGCKKLSKIVVKTTTLKAKDVGSNAFKTGNAKSIVKLPSKRLDTYKAMLLKKGMSKKTKFIK